MSAKPSLKNLFFFLLILLTAGCQDYSEFTSEQIKRSEYEKNFENVFGPIDPNQSWDLSSWARHQIGLPGAKNVSTSRSSRAITCSGTPGALMTRHGSNISVSPTSDRQEYTETRPTNWITIDDDLTDWLGKKLKEGTNNTGLGYPFELMRPDPDTKFAIVPLFQGMAGMDWDLHLVSVADDGTETDYKLWNESQDVIFEYYDSDDSENADNGKWFVPGTTYGQSQFGDNSGSTFIPRARTILGRPMIIDNTKLSPNFYLYLHVTNSDGNYAKEGSKQRSDFGMMISLTLNNVDRTIKEKYDARFTKFAKDNGLIASDADNTQWMIIGCEDADIGSDWDMNDVAFLIIGLPVMPKTVEVAKKRYLVEDLGTTFDFDFNDIVVDVTQEINHNVSPATITQTAIIQHEGGTLPYVLTVGNTVFDQRPGHMYQNDKTLKRLVVKENVTGWNPASNNVSIEVFQPGSQIQQNVDTPDSYEINFPTTGSVPLIIAVDQSFVWEDELEPIEGEWIFDEEVGKWISAFTGNVIANLDNGTLPKDIKWGVGYSIPESKFASAEAGDKLVIEVSKVANDKIVRVSYDGSDWSTNAYSNNSATDGKIEVELTQEILDNINGNSYRGVVLTGNTYTVDRVYITRPVYYSVTVTSNDENMGTVSVSPNGQNGKYEPGTQLTLKASAKSGYIFDRWSDGDTTNPRSKTVSGSINLQAIFRARTQDDPADERYITLPWEGDKQIGWDDADHIIVEASQFSDVEAGDKLVITRTGNGSWQYCYTYPEWTENAVTSGNDVNYTLTQSDVDNLKAGGMQIQGDETVTVTSVKIVKPKYWTVTVSVDPSCEGMGTVSKSASSRQDGKYEDGTQVTLTATPNTGYHFEKWSDNVTTNPRSVTVNSDVEYTAQFAEGEITNVVLWEGSQSGQFQVLAYDGEKSTQSGGTISLLDALDTGLTTLVVTFDRVSNVWYEYLGAKENGTGGWHKLGGGNTNGSDIIIDLSSYVETIKTENGLVIQGGDYGNIIKVEAKKPASPAKKQARRRK